MSDQIRSIGIDFGTTNSSMAWYDPRTGTSEVILNAEGQTRTPSLVYFGEDEILVGESVDSLIENVSADRAQREEVVQRTVKSIKRDLITPPRIALPGGRFVRPVDVVAEILKKLKRDAEDGHFHEEVGRAVITCPAEFNVLQRQKIEEAGHLAGFREVVLLEEPVAGALAYARAGLNVGKNVLVYDLGGGTFDLAILANEGDSFRVAMEPKGLERCGGDDFDHALYYHCDELAREKLGRGISLMGAIDLSFLRECRRRKESLTYHQRGKFSDYLPSDNGPLHFEYEVDRTTFEGLIEEYIETSTRLTEGILKQAHAAGHAVDTVVLVGGSTRVPLVTRALKETLPVSPLAFDKKDVAIALGAAHCTEVQWPSKRRARKQEKSVTTPSKRERLLANQYAGAVKDMASNRKLSKVEVDRLNAFAGQLGLSPEQIAGIERHILGNSKEGILLERYRQAVKMVWVGEKLSRLEMKWLEAVGAELGLGRNQTSHLETQIMGASKEAILAQQSSKPEPPESLVEFDLAHTLAGHSDEVNSVAFSPNGSSLVSGASDHTIRGWSVRSGQLLGTLAGHTGRVSSVAFSTDEKLLASASFDKSVRIWKLPNGEPFRTLNHPEWVFSVVVGPNNKILASGGADKEIKLWNLETGGLLRTLAGHSHWVLSVAFTPDGRGLVSSSADKTVKVWNLKADESSTSAPLRTFEHPDWVWTAAVSPNGRFVATGGEDGAIRIWNLQTGKSVGAIAGHSGPIRSVALSLDGSLVFGCSADAKIRVWNLRTGKLLDILSGHRKSVNCVALSPNGRFLASGSSDRTVRIWEETRANEASNESATVHPSYPQVNLPSSERGNAEVGRGQAAVTQHRDAVKASVIAGEKTGIVEEQRLLGQVGELGFRPGQYAARERGGEGKAEKTVFEEREQKPERPLDLPD